MDNNTAMPSYPSPSAALMQPTFMPWQGYFYLISSVDIFVLLDDFQFCRSTWHQRNRLFSNADTPGWYSVPVERHSGMPNINEVTINDRTPWREKMLQTIKQNYKKAEYFNEVFPHIEHWFNSRTPNLAVFNELIIRGCCDLLGIKTKIILSSSLGSEGKKSARVVDILQKIGAVFYLAAQGSYEYMNEEKEIFESSGLELAFYQFNANTHKQYGAKSFHSHLSILDALLNIGGAQTRALLAAGGCPALSWSEMQVRFSETGKFGLSHEENPELS